MFKGKSLSPGATIGILGGGQLGRMTAEAAAELGFKTHIYCPEPDNTASKVANFSTIAPYTDQAQLEAFAESVDVITFEFENIPHESLTFLDSRSLTRPNSNALLMSQNRVREKDFLNKKVGAPVAAYFSISSADELQQAFNKISSGKAVLKTVELGYDGKGQRIIEKGDDLESVWNTFGQTQAILEEFMNFDKEISVMIARSVNGDVAIYPPGENTHINGILDTTVVPANVPHVVLEEAKEIAGDIIVGLDIVGILGVEFFVMPDGRLMVNEIAPRPHNSGHWTMDGAETSQFTQFILAVAGGELGPVGQKKKIRMKNLIGEDIHNLDAFRTPGARYVIHDYDKGEARPGRKMGHVNYIEALG